MKEKIVKSARSVMRVIRSRRSVRRFARQKPPSGLVRRILEAGRWAPSGLNNQPWRFLVISDDLTKERLAALTKYGGIVRRAPRLIVVCLDTADSYNREKDLMAVGACIQNMLLTAAALGLGACWLGEILNQKEEVHRRLRLDSDLELMALVALGYPGLRGIGRRKPLNQLMAATNP